jgi:hypothetical protein
MFDFTKADKTDEEIAAAVHGWIATLAQQNIQLPCKISAAVDLATALGFETDPDQVLTLIAKDFVDAIDDDGQVLMDEQSLFSLVVALEARRSWLIGSDLHHHKFTPEEMQRIGTRPDNNRETYLEVLRYDMSYLIAIAMASLDDDHIVKTCLQALRLKAEELGVLYE